MILFEGLYALANHCPLDFFKYCKRGVYLEAAEEDIYSWKWEREQTKKSPRTKEQFALHMKEIFFDFYLNVAPSKEQADFVIFKDSDHHYFLKAIND